MGMSNRQFYVMLAIAIVLVAVIAGGVVGYQHNREHGPDRQVVDIEKSAGVK